jgi:hypothetical protein
VLFTFPSRYLFTIGRQGVFSLGRWSSRIPTGFHVSRGTQDACRGRPVRFDYGALTRYGAPFQALRLRTDLVTSRGIRHYPTHASYDPSYATPTGLTHIRFRLFPFRSPLLWESNFFLFLRVLRCFTSPRSPPPDYVFIGGISRHYPGWVAPFGHPRIKACLAAPRGFSQLTASFIASWRQGIHHLPLVA